MKLFRLLLLTLPYFSAAAQDNPTELAQPIVAEGKLLYKSEMASWYGTDVFIEAYKDHSAIGGYFSYTTAILPGVFSFRRQQNRLLSERLALMTHTKFLQQLPTLPHDHSRRWKKVFMLSGKLHRLPLTQTLSLKVTLTQSLI